MNESSGEAERMKKLYELAQSMAKGRKAGLTYAEWLQQNPQGPDQPYHPLAEPLERIYNDMKR
jgi:hypothetical protein